MNASSMTTLFFAQASPGAGPIQIVPYILILFVFYLLVIRPNQTEQRDHLVVLEIADKVRVIIDKPSVKRRLDVAAEPPAATGKE
jgi:hypothetical protein